MIEACHSRGASVSPRLARAWRREPGMTNIVIGPACASPRSEWQGSGRRPMQGGLRALWRVGILSTATPHGALRLSLAAIMTYHSISRGTGALGVCAAVAIAGRAHADPR